MRQKKSYCGEPGCAGARTCGKCRAIKRAEQRLQAKSGTLAETGSGRPDEENGAGVALLAVERAAVLPAEVVQVAAELAVPPAAEPAIEPERPPVPEVPGVFRAARLLDSGPCDFTVAKGHCLRPGKRVKGGYRCKIHWRA